MFSLSGKVAFVTGAATGLGAAISVALAQNGADVAISDKSNNSLDTTARAINDVNRRSYAIELDVSNISHIHDVVSTIEQQFGPIDILVNNAGINVPMLGVEVTESNWDDHFATNVKGGFFTAQASARGMIARGWGRIIFVSSQSGLVGVPGQPVYCATKGAVNQLVRTLGIEWAKFGITVNAVAPTFVETNLTRVRLQNPQFRAFVLNKIPCGNLALPEHVGTAVAYLASNEATMVNCDILRVDGGWTAW